VSHTARVAIIEDDPPTSAQRKGWMLSARPVTKNYNVNEYTFAAEKTFLDGMTSVELRVPFQTGLSSKLNISAGNITGVSNGAYAITTTPENTLGQEATEFGNMTLIFKGALYQTRAFVLSAGFAVEIPTGEDENVYVHDFAGTTPGPFADLQRQRNFHIANDTWAIDPFVAVLVAPSERWFAQAFLQVDLPLNKSHYSFSDVWLEAPNSTIFTTGPGIFAPLFDANTRSAPFTVYGSLPEQTLMHVSFDTGYWVYVNPSARWITGFAPALELNYTTTLENARIATLPEDFSLAINPANPSGPFVQEAHSTIGNLRNRVDILDMTVGGTLKIGDNSSLALGVGFPLRSNKDDRVYNWEGLLEFNVYFGNRFNAPNVLR
jgi:hypothetical protein